MDIAFLRFVLLTQGYGRDADAHSEAGVGLKSVALFCAARENPYI